MKRLPHDVALHHERDRCWLEIDEDAKRKLDAGEGDRVDVVVDGRPLTGIMGTKARIWFVEDVDVESAQAVTIRRRRRV